MKIRPLACFPSRPGPGRGVVAFTLIEVLLALGLLTMALGTVYASWMSVVKASKVGLAAAVTAQRERMAVRIVAEAVMGFQTNQANGWYYTLTNESTFGGGEIHSWVAKLPASFPRSGKFRSIAGGQFGFDMRRVTFSLEAGPDRQKQLVLRQNPILMELDADEQVHPVVLARDVKFFRVGPWDADKNEFIDETMPSGAMKTNRLWGIQLQVNYQGTHELRAGETITRWVNLGGPAVGVAQNWQIPGGAGTGGTRTNRNPINPPPPTENP